MKYEARRDSSADAEMRLQGAQESLQPEIEGLRRVYHEYDLWNRAPTDGALAFRTNREYLVS